MKNDHSTPDTQEETHFITQLKTQDGCVHLWFLTVILGKYDNLCTKLRKLLMVTSCCQLSLNTQ